ncbi:MAG TPA: hypothetical protein VD833_20095 [Vicinamibacterales bacterium]|nr:hypothetical protein [Vicinamibacterales bacterium]
MRGRSGFWLLGIVIMLVRTGGYTDLADAIAMGYLAVLTAMVQQFPSSRSTPRAVPVAPAGALADR